MNTELHGMVIAVERRDLNQRAARGWVAAEVGRTYVSRNPVIGALRWTRAMAGAGLAGIGALTCDSREGLLSREQQLASYGVSWVSDPEHDADLAQELKTARERRHAGVLVTLPAQSNMPTGVHSGIRLAIGAALVQVGQRLQGGASIEVAPEARA